MHDRNHFAGTAGDAAVGESLFRRRLPRRWGGVGEDEVDGRFGDGREDFEAVAVEEAGDGAFRR